MSKQTKSKLKNNRQTTKEPNPGLLTFYPAVPDSSVTDVFRRSINRKQRDGANTILEKFLMVMETVRSRSGSFDVETVIREGKVYDLDPIEVKNLFFQWCEVQLNFHRISEIRGAYDSPVYICV